MERTQNQRVQDWYHGAQPIGAPPPVNNILADPKWAGGDYYGTGDAPAAGLAVARMAAHITYLSEAGLTSSYTLALSSEPTADVTITASADAQVRVNGAASVALRPLGMCAT